MPWFHWLFSNRHFIRGELPVHYEMMTRKYWRLHLRYQLARWLRQRQLLKWWIRLKWAWRKNIATLRMLGLQSLHFVFPPTCPGCGQHVRMPHLFCARCWSRLIFITPPMCRICGKMFEFALDESECCVNCCNWHPEYDQARSLLVYNDLAADLIHAFKYSDQPDLCKCFSRQVQNLAGEFFQDVDYLIPVPLHPKRLRHRKYNQSGLLAEAIGKRLGIPVLHQALLRVINTIPQVQLSGKERLHNLHGAFRVDSAALPLLIGKHLMLIDDVMTTGSTVSHCAKVLKQQAQAAEVKVFTLARTNFGIAQLDATN